MGRVENKRAAATGAASGCYGEPPDALYLAFEESRFITGSEPVIDGGWSER